MSDIENYNINFMRICLLFQLLQLLQPENHEIDRHPVNFATLMVSNVG